MAYYRQVGLLGIYALYFADTLDGVVVEGVAPDSVKSIGGIYYDSTGAEGVDREVKIFLIETRGVHFQYCHGQ